MKDTILRLKKTHVYFVICYMQMLSYTTSYKNIKFIPIIALYIYIHITYKYEVKYQSRTEAIPIGQIYCNLIIDRFHYDYLKTYLMISVLCEITLRARQGNKVHIQRSGLKFAYLRI